MRDGHVHFAFCLTAELLSLLDLDEEALDDYRLSIRHYREKAETLYRIGLCLHRMGRREEAEANLTRSCELDPELRDRRDVQMSLQDKIDVLEEHHKNFEMMNKKCAGFETPESVQHNGRVLAAELGWFLAVLEDRIVRYFQEVQALDPLKLPPPDLTEKGCPYAIMMVNRHNLSPGSDWW